MAGERAQIVGAAVTHVGKVREHNEDAHFLDADLGLFVVCDGMGGHAAGEVASALAIRTIRSRWSGEETLKVADYWLGKGTHEAKKALLATIRAGVVAAHDAILAEAARDDAKKGMGTTLVGAMIVGGDVVFAHAGDSRAYLVRDHIAMQLTEDHTLLARLTAAGIDVDVEGEGSRFKSMLTNALGIGTECRIATFILPLADGDRFLLCSDGISEYVTEAEVGEVLTKQPSPARAAQKLVELALERGGGDNATAVVVRVLEAGETPQPAELRRKDDEAIKSCALWTAKVTPQQRLRALRIAMPRDYVAGDKLLAQTLGDRVAWIIVEGEVEIDGKKLGAGALLYAECLVEGSHTPERDGLAVARGDVRALALRSDDFRELCDDDSELGEALLEGLAELIAAKRSTKVVRRSNVVGAVSGAEVDPRSATDPSLKTISRQDAVKPAAKPDPKIDAKPDAKPDARVLPRSDPKLGETRIPVVAAEPRRPSEPRLEAKPAPRPLEADPAKKPPPTPPLLKSLPSLSSLGPKPIPKITEARPPAEVSVTKLDGGKAQVAKPEPKWVTAETKPDVKPPEPRPMPPLSRLTPPTGIRLPSVPGPKPTPPAGLAAVPKPTPPTGTAAVAATNLANPATPIRPKSVTKPQVAARPAEAPVAPKLERAHTDPPEAADEPTGPRKPITPPPPSADDDLVADDSGVAVLIVAGPPVDSGAVSSSPLVESLLNLVESGAPELDLANDVLSLVDPPSRFGRAMTADPHIETYELDRSSGVRAVVSPFEPEFEEEEIEAVSVAEGDAVTKVRQLPLFPGDADEVDDDDSALPGETTLVVRAPPEPPESLEPPESNEPEEHSAKHTPITSEETNVASGTISTPDHGPRRAKRLTDGWSDE